MAELGEIGGHCGLDSCHQLDFLPVACVHCGLKFCSKHANTGAHNCVKAPRSQISSEEAKSLRSRDVYQCSFRDCTKTELAPILCSKCQMQVCLQHRHQVDHKCPEYEPYAKDNLAKTKEVVQNIVQKAEEKPAKPKRLRNEKSQKLAAKVQLMKIKMKAKSSHSVPQQEKVFFKVILPKSKGCSIEVCVSQVWPLGRVIDSAAQLGKVSNKNNVQGAKKLRLFRFQDGEHLTVDFQRTVESLISASDLFNGDTLVMEYIADDEDCEIEPGEYNA